MRRAAKNALALQAELVSLQGFLRRPTARSGWASRIHTGSTERLRVVVTVRSCPVWRTDNSAVDA